jgi:hypothetical protein
MSTDRLFSEIYKQLDEKHREEIRPKPLNLLATSNLASERLLYKYYPDEIHYEEESERSTKKKSLCQWILWVLSRLWDGSWFHYPVIPPGPWNTVYGYRSIPKRYTMGLIYSVDIL